MNYSDAERIASVFNMAGYEPAKTEAEADIAVVVACSVRQTAIDRIYGKVKPWDKRRRKTDFKTVLAGCVLPEDKKKLAKSFDLIFDIKEIKQLEEFFLSLRLPERAARVGQGGAERRGNLGCHSALDAESSDGRKKIPASAGMTSNNRDYLSIVPKYESPFRAYVPIMTGCDNFCSYCAVPYTRGREKSRSAEDIVAECQALVSKGYKEITLLGQNVNSYSDSAPVIPTEAEESLKETSKGISRQARNDNFAELLKVIDKIEGDYRVYFYSNHPKDFSDELIDVLPKLKHFPQYIHLPLQSGSDNILRQMNRHYTQEDYLDLVEKIRKSMPEVVLTTDVMVGFPGETEEDFGKTMEVIRKVKYEMIFIGQYSPRAGTPSSKMKDNVPLAIKKRRDVAITDYLRSYLADFNQKFVGQSVRVLIDEIKPARSTDGGDKYYGRTDGYKVVEISSSPNSIAKSYVVGQFYNIKINEVEAWKLFG